MTNLLYITTRIPAPNERGDQLRAFHQLRILCKTTKITLICLSKEKEYQSLIKPLQDLGIEVHCFYLPTWKRYMALKHAVTLGIPFQVAYFFNQKIEAKIRSLVVDKDYDIVHCHLIRAALYARSLKANIRSIDYMDAYAFGMDLRYSSTRGFLKRLLLKSERNRLLKFEKKSFSEFDRHFAISQQDALRINHSSKDNILVSSNGIDFDQFYPKNLQKKYDLVFMGNMDYPPNIAAVRFIYEKILPTILQQMPSVKFLIAGRNATKLVQSYQSKSIDVVQHFDDISDALASAKILLAPMTISIGVQNKILQAMAMKVPCITSEAANNAIGAVPNEHILIANSAHDFIHTTLKLLRNETLQLSIAESAHEFVNERFTWESCAQSLLSSIQ